MIAQRLFKDVKYNKDSYLFRILYKQRIKTSLLIYIDGFYGREHFMNSYSYETFFFSYNNICDLVVILFLHSNRHKVMYLFHV